MVSCARRKALTTAWSECAARSSSPREANARFSRWCCGRGWKGGGRELVREYGGYGARMWMINRLDGGQRGPKESSNGEEGVLPAPRRDDHALHHYQHHQILPRTCSASTSASSAMRPTSRRFSARRSTRPRRGAWKAKAGGGRPRLWW